MGQVGTGRSASIVIAVDGPAGAGKSTVGRILASRFGYLYVDTGAMYRALTLKALRTGTPTSDGAAIARLAATTVVSYSPEGVLLDGENVEGQLRNPDIDRHVSLVAAVREVRECLTAAQRELAKRGGVVMEGRDIGTCVLPGADVKLYLTASLEERARRRLGDMKRLGYEKQLGEVAEELAQRDRMDSSRALAPLAVAPDAVVIDTTHMAVEEVVATALEHVEGEARDCFTP